MATLTQKQQKRLKEIKGRVKELENTHSDDIKKGAFVKNITAKIIPEMRELIEMIEPGTVAVAEPEEGGEDAGE